MRRPSFEIEFHYDIRPVGQGLFIAGRLSFFQRGTPTGDFFWVYDCGSSNQNLARDEARVLSAALGDRGLDLFVLSHFDWDHLRGLDALLEGGRRIQHLYLPYLFPAERLVVGAFGTDGGFPDPDGSADWADFVRDPAGYLRDRYGQRIGRIHYILPVEGSPPLPILEGPVNPTLDRTLPAKPPGEEWGFAAGAEKRWENGVPRDAELYEDSSTVHRDANGNWEFCFFNDPSPHRRVAEWLPSAEAQLNQWTKESKGGHAFQLLKELKLTLESVVKGSPARNQVSLQCYCGPVPKSLKHSEFGPDDPGDSKYSSKDAHRGTHPVRRPKGISPSTPPLKVSLLCTGDITMSHEFREILKAHLFPERWESIQFLQIPHHGSDHSWETPQNQFWNHAISFISARNSSKFPGPVLLMDLKSRTKVLISDAKTGHFIKGLCQW